MELWCDCPRQSIDFDSLRGAPPPGPQGRNRGTFVSATAKPETSVIPTAASAEWRNPPRWTKNHHKIKLATREDSSTPLGMTCRGVVPFNQTGYIRYGASPSPGLDGVGSTPLHCSVYGVVPFNRTGCIRYVAGGRLPPLRQRTTFSAFFETQNNDRHVQYTVKRNKCIVGAATCRPPRWMFNLWG